MLLYHDCGKPRPKCDYHKNWSEIVSDTLTKLNFKETSTASEMFKKKRKQS